MVKNNFTYFSDINRIFVLQKPFLIADWLIAWLIDYGLMSRWEILHNQGDVTFLPVRGCKIRSMLGYNDLSVEMDLFRSTPVLRSAELAPANVRRLNNISDVIFYCSVGERSQALALLNAALCDTWPRCLLPTLLQHWGLYCGPFYPGSPCTGALYLSILRMIHCLFKRFVSWLRKS